MTFTMNPATALQLQLTSQIGLDSLLGFVGLPSRRSVRQDLSIKVDEVFRGITALLDGFLVRAVAARTKDEFIVTRDELFGDYARLLMQLTKLVNIVVPRKTIDVLSGESFCELEAEVREHGLERFGTAARDQAMFTIWTLRRTSTLVSKIAEIGPTSKDLRQQDAELALEFSFCSAWTEFHLDCLMAAIRFDKAIQPDVLEEIQDGLRAAVNAYGMARKGVVLRDTHQESLSLEGPVWDDEDQELLDASMYDMDAELL